MGKENEVTVKERGYWRHLAVTTGLVLLIAVVVLTNMLSSEEGTGLSSVEGQVPPDDAQEQGYTGNVTTLSVLPRSLNEMIEYADVIVTGVVGDIIAEEAIPEEHTYTDEEVAEIEAQGGSVDTLVIFKNISTTEVLKGEIADNFPLGMLDYRRGIVDYSHVESGEHLLLFLHAEGGKSYSAKSFERYYTTMSVDNGIFDLNGDMATPRAPHPFDGDQRFDNEGGYIAVSLDKVRSSIEDYKGSQLSTN